MFSSFKILRCHQMLGRVHGLHRVTSAQNKDNPKSQPSSKKPDDSPIEYVVKFRQIDVKATFKKFYSVYGPLFVVCHIGISLCSLGIFCSIVWLTVNPSQYIPERLLIKLGENLAKATEGGGKFVLAYAMHKLILPFRLAGAIYLTRLLAPKVKNFGFLKSKAK